MSIQRIFRGGRAPALDGETHLGPAQVESVTAGVPTVVLSHGERTVVQLALAFPYMPVEGDELLVLGTPGRYFAVGVLSANAALSLQFPGDVKLHADRRMQLDAEQEITLAAPDVEVRASTVRITADSVVETARELFQRIKDTWNVRAGQKTEQVAGEWSARAERASIVTREDVSVNGQEIRLG